MSPETCPHCNKAPEYFRADREGAEFSEKFRPFDRKAFLVAVEEGDVRIRCPLCDKTIRAEDVNPK